MKDKLNWGIIGTGRIAADFTQAVQASERVRVVSAVGSTPERGRAFAERWRLPGAAATLDDLLALPAVDAVYIATPHPLHADNALRVIAAGKAVLCEKPLTLDAESAARVIDAARAADVFLLEAFMYRCHPLIRQVLGLLREGAIGRVRHVSAHFGFRAPRQATSRLYHPALGGGGILDVGGYPLSFARLVAGVAEDQPFAEPVRLHGAGFVGPHGADELASALLRFSSGMTAALTCGVHYDAGTEAQIFGEEGKLVLPNPWVPRGQPHGLESDFTLHRDGRAPESFVVRTTLSTYALEAELVAASLPGREAKWPAMTWADTLGNMRALDAWRAELQVVQ